MSSLLFIVPMPANLTNNGARRSTHWRQKYRDRTDYWESLDLIATCGRLATEHGIAYTIPQPPPVPFDHATLHSTMYLGNWMDDDNALARHKSLGDWLVTRGYLVDDKKKHVEWLALPAQVVKRGQCYRIELIMTPVSPDAPRAELEIDPIPDTAHYLSP